MQVTKLGFDDPRSALFFEYVRVLRAIKPHWFLLENVKMKKNGSTRSHLISAFNRSS